MLFLLVCGTFSAIVVRLWPAFTVQETETPPSLTCIFKTVPKHSPRKKKNSCFQDLRISPSLRQRTVKTVRYGGGRFWIAASTGKPGDALPLCTYRLFTDAFTRFLIGCCSCSSVQRPFFLLHILKTIFLIFTRVRAWVCVCVSMVPFAMTCTWM